MAKDFLSSQIRTTKIIAADSTSPQILMYPSGSASDNEGGTSAGLLTDVGNDVFLFVSGSKCGKANSTPSSVALFGGDVVISGSLYVEQSDISLWEEDNTLTDCLIPTNIIDGDTGLFAMDFSPLFNDSGNMIESSQYTMTNRSSVGDKYFEFDSEDNVTPRVDAVCS